MHAVNLRGQGASEWPGTYSLGLFADDVAVTEVFSVAPSLKG